MNAEGEFVAINFDRQRLGLMNEVMPFCLDPDSCSSPPSLSLIRCYHSAHTVRLERRLLEEHRG
jgi:hypothetical protein